MRSGVVAQKIGMTRLFTDAGEHVPVTVLRLAQCQVVAHRSKDKNGYVALQLGSGPRRANNMIKADRGYFAKAKLEPKRKLAEFRVSDDALIPVGAEITADHFVEGQFVDVCGISIGKGFAGGMKRWNFGGLRASHGVSVSHRSIGSTGGRQDPGKTFKNKKMPGHMGVDRITTLNLRVVQTDVARGLIMVEGAVPGTKGGWITVRDAVKKTLPKEVPQPGKFRITGEASQGAAGALLLVHLLAGTPDVGTPLHRMGAGAALGELPDDAALDEILARLQSEDVVGQADRTLGLAVERRDFQFHVTHSPRLGQLRLGPSIHCRRA